MVLELAQLHIIPGKEQEFEAVFQKASKIIASVPSDIFCYRSDLRFASKKNRMDRPIEAKQKPRRKIRVAVLKPKVKSP